MDEPASSPQAVRAQLAELGITPSRRMGQNFLCDRGANEQIVELAGVSPATPVLEVGPGLGNLTARLLDRGANVTAVELDARLYYHLRNEARGDSRLTLVHEDALAGKHALGPGITTWLGALTPDRPGVVASNLPYQIASPLLVLLLQAGAPLARIVACVQLEVARRLIAQPSTADYGALTVLVGLAAHVEIAMRMGPSRFWPQPKVESAVVVLTPRRHDPAPRDPAAFARFSHAAFAQRRKTIAAALRQAGWGPEGGAPIAIRAQRELEQRGLSPAARAESLSIGELVTLYDALAPETP